MKYIVVENEYGMYENEQDSVNLVMLTDDPQKICDFLKGMSRDRRRDHNVLEITPEMLAGPFSLNLKNSGQGGEDFYQKHQKPIKAKP